MNKIKVGDTVKLKTNFPALSYGKSLKFKCKEVRPNGDLGLGALGAAQDCLYIHKKDVEKVDYLIEVGDIVICIKERRYGITNGHTRCKVVKIHNQKMIQISPIEGKYKNKGFNVEIKNFKVAIKNNMNK